MTACPRLLVAQAALLLLTACEHEQPQTAPAAQRPPLPPLQLEPMQAKLDALAARLQPPDENTRRELQEMADIALNIVAADSRTHALIERSLLEHEAAWWPLEQALQHEDPAVRSRAAWLCGRTGRTVLQFPLLLRLKYELDPEAILWVAEALFRLGNDAGLGWLDAAMAPDQTPELAGWRAIEVCRAAAIELGESPTYAQLQEHLRAMTARWSSTGVGACPDVPAAEPAQLEARVAARLAVTAGTQLRPVDDSRFVLTRSGRLPLTHLQPALAAEEPYLRTMVLQVITEIGEPARDCGTAILPLLGDPLTAAYAVRALGRIGYAAAIPHVRPLLGIEDLELRAAAAATLGLLADEASRAPLAARLADETEAMDVRVQAAFGLGLLGDGGAGRAFLDARLEQGDYHGPMLRRLLEELDARVR